MTDWATTAASAATAFGTLVLAGATYFSVRSAQQGAKATEAALRSAIRPLVLTSHLEDPDQKVRFVDDVWLHVQGGHASAQVSDEVIYLLISLRNAGNGLAVLDRWSIYPGTVLDDWTPDLLERFRRLTRDIYVPAGDLGFWQGAIRGADDPQFEEIRTAITDRSAMTIDLLYGDQLGGQRTVSRISLSPSRQDDWMATVGRHWHLDSPSPR